MDCCLLLLIWWRTWLPVLDWLSFAFCSTECQNYRSLTNADRKVTSSTSAFGIVCDYQLGSGWFRFEGAAGTRMPSSCISNPQLRWCHTLLAGWLNGDHPTVADGRVTRRVCFSYVTPQYLWDCCYKSIDIQVRNCGSFYVYHLYAKAELCTYRYCGSD